MYKEYDKEVLKKLQRVELSILKDFISIAEKNDISYFAIGGTAIGAVRHKGFIPWDDDIDLAISRKDYEKLEKIISRDYSEKYEMLSAKTNDKYPILEGHMQIKGTKFIDDATKNLKCNMGIFLDFFIYDNISDNAEERKKQIKDAKIYGKLLILRDMAYPVLPFNGLLGKIFHVGTAIVHSLMVIFRISHKKLYEKVTQASIRYNDKETENVALFRDLYIEESTMKKADIFPLQSAKFEDIEILLPNKNHEILTKYYGDYMKLPPKEKRVNHSPYILDFGKEVY